MKKIFLLITIAMLGLVACSQKNNKQQTKEMKTLVAYFSCTGNTKAVAAQLAEVVGADLFEIEPVQLYSAEDLDWRNEQSRSSVEMKDPASRPEVAKKVENMDDYNVVYLGFPIWWDQAPRIVSTFIDQNNLNGKTVKIFATSGSSTIDNSLAELKKNYPDVQWVDAKLLTGATKEVIEQWVK